jgi:hypothetical protein
MVQHSRVLALLLVRSRSRPSIPRTWCLTSSKLPVASYPASLRSPQPSSLHARPSRILTRSLTGRRRPPHRRQARRRYRRSRPSEARHPSRLPRSIFFCATTASKEGFFRQRLQLRLRIDRMDANQGAGSNNSSDFVCAHLPREWIMANIALGTQAVQVRRGRWFEMSRELADLCDRMLENPSDESVVRWGNDGDSFVVLEVGL